jgi:hypothetical protein
VKELCCTRCGAGVKSWAALEDHQEIHKRMRLILSCELANSGAC